MAAWQSSLKVANLYLPAWQKLSFHKVCRISMLDIFLVFVVQTYDGLNRGRNKLSSDVGPNIIISMLDIKSLFGRRKCFVDVFFPSLLVIRNPLQFFWKCCRATWYTAHIYQTPPLLNPHISYSKPPAW